GIRLGFTLILFHLHWTDGGGVDYRSTGLCIVTAYPLDAELAAFIRQHISHFPPQFVEDIHRMRASGGCHLLRDTHRDGRQVGMMAHLQHDKSTGFLNDAGSADERDLGAGNAAWLGCEWRNNFAPLLPGEAGRRRCRRAIWVAL